MKKNRKKIRLSLATKFNLLIISSILMTAVGLSYFVVKAEIKNVRQELLDHGLVLAEMTAKTCEPGILQGNKASLSQIIKGLALNPDIVYVRIKSTADAVLTETLFNPSVALSKEGSRFRASSPGQTTLAKFINESDGKEYFEVRAPVWKGSAEVILPEFSIDDPRNSKKRPQLLGFVYLGLGQEKINTRISHFILNTALITALLVLVGVGLTFFLTKRITSPAQRLQKAAEEIADRKFDGYIAINSNDEISDLAQAFNTMLVQLKQYQNQVNGRTSQLTRANELMQQEIEERKRFEGALRDSEERFRSLIETASEAIFTLDGRGTILTWSPAGEVIFGYTDREVIGESVTLLIKESDDHHYYQNEFNRLLMEDPEPGAEITIQTLGLKKDATEFPIEISAASYRTGNEKYLTVILRDITERRQAEEQLKQAATHDPLSGLYNRNFFEEEMRLLSNEREMKVGLLLLDIDGLKFVNDTFGHPEGDRLLKEVADLLKKNFRPSEVIARIGGDEFAVILKNIDQTKLEAAVLRFKNSILSYNKGLPKGKHPVSVSMGCDVRDDFSKTLLESFKEADRRLLLEKIPKREDVRKSILTVLKATMVEKDHGTEEHMGRMQSLAHKFAEKVGLSEEESKKVVLATELHDIGKVVIPDDILNKDGPLTDQEFEIIKKHPETGYRIAKATPEIAQVAEAIWSAHERWDGRGYPRGLKGEEIPLVARMVFILDAFDVMMNDRPYRKALSPGEAKAELEGHAGSQFDPDLVAVFVKEVLAEKD